MVGKTTDDPEQPAIPELDPQILTALGDATEDAPQFGPKIHEKLASLWLPILRKGLEKEAKSKLLKDYQVPENCSLLQAPKLNPEISAAINEGTRARDKRVEEVQQQLGQGISALNKGLELLFDDSTDRVQAIKFFSDGCRILCDLHHTETEARKKFINPGLDKSFLHIMQDVERDDMLFGKKLSDKIKATKVIEKHGLQIKKPAPIPKIPAYQPSTSRSRPQGNWGGPPRFPSARGGRGGHKKTTSAPRRVQSVAVPQKPPVGNKQRAPAHQQ